MDTGNLFIRGARILTMDAALGDLPCADVLVRDGRIEAVGPNLSAPPGWTALDGTDRLVMPGFVDTHWHMWTSLFRGYTNQTPDRNYIAVRNRLGSHVTAQDVYASVRLSLVEALAAGFTTVHDWAHNMNSPAHADATVRAHRDVPLRARFSWGAPHWLAADQTLDLAEVSRVQAEHFAGDSPLLHLGVAMRGPEFGGSTPDVCRREWAHARALGLPITVHVAEFVDTDRWQAIAKLHADGLLGPDVQLVHGVHVTPEERQLILASGSHVSITPTVEAMAGMGVPPISDYIEEGMLLGLSLDVSATSNPADMFSLMRTTLALERFRSYQRSGHIATGSVLRQRPHILTPRKLLEMATIDGARALGLGDVTGSLTPGKRADLVVLRLGDPNLSTSAHADASQLLVFFGQPSNVESVVVDGRLLKHQGRLQGIDADAAAKACSQALDGLLARVPG
jgi:5-methylthioadenosine/S-adenosylhomocysteine deaminase